MTWPNASSASSPAKSVVSPTQSRNVERRPCAVWAGSSLLTTSSSARSCSGGVIEAAREDEVRHADLAHLLEDRERPWRQWDGMRAARPFTGLQPLRRDRPQPRVEIDLGPFCADHFGGARRGQEQELESARRQRYPLAQPGDEGRGVPVGQGGEIAALDAFQNAVALDRTCRPPSPWRIVLANSRAGFGCIESTGMA